MTFCKPDASHYETKLYFKLAMNMKSFFCLIFVANTFQLFAHSWEMPANRKIGLKNLKWFLKNTPLNKMSLTLCFLNHFPFNFSKKKMVTLWRHIDVYMFLDLKSGIHFKLYFFKLYISIEWIMCLLSSNGHLFAHRTGVCKDFLRCSWTSVYIAAFFNGLLCFNQELSLFCVIPLQWI